MEGKPTYEELQARVEHLQKILRDRKIEPKRIEIGDALQESEERYRTIFNSVQDLIYITSTDLRIISLNPAFEKITGWSAQEWIGKKSTSLIHPEDLTLSNKKVEKLLSGEKIAPTALRILTKSGEYRTLEFIPALLVKEGRQAGILGIGRDITVRIRAEKALQESEEKYRLLFETMSQGVVYQNAEGRIISSNSAAERILGLSLDQMMGRTLMDPCWQAIREDGSEFHGETHPSMVALRTRKEVKNVVMGVFNHRTDAYHWININAVPHFNPGQDAPYQVYTTLDDITDRRGTEEALKRSEERYRNLFELSPDGIMIWQNEKAALANPAAMRMLAAASADEIIGKSVYEIHPADCHDAVRARRRYLDETGLPAAPTEYRFIRLDGQTIDVEATGTRINYQNHPAVLSFYRDISERKRAEKALRLSHERFLTVLNSIDAAIYVADMKTYEILFMNKYMIESFGRDMTGKICWQAFRGESGPCALCTNDHLVDDRGDPVDMCAWQGKNPKTGKWYIHYDRAIHWIDDRIVRIQISTDITELKKLEEERILSEKRLRQAHKMEAIGTLAGGIAHDFNNILFSIIGMSELLLEDLPKGSPEHGNAREILKAGKRASDLIKQILTFSRKSELQKIPVRIQQVLKEVLKLTRATIPSNIEIDQDIENDCGAVMTDPTQVHQIALNLITNAYHAMEPKGGKISVGLKQIALESAGEADGSLGPGRYAVLSVSDTGCGIDPAIKDKIFEPYFTTREQRKGTGLGLAMVYGIVKEHNGDIKVNSEPGMGTTFDVYLPSMEMSPEALPVEGAEDDKTGNERILLVDDEESIVRLERMMLERLGYLVTSRLSSIEALEAFRAHPDGFDLVVTDMTMPNMTGDQLAGELVSIRPGIPIIICTGYSERINPEKAAAIGMKGFLMKPIVRSEMAGMVRKVLDQAKGRC